MSQPVTVTVNGSVRAAPSATTALVPSLMSDVMISLNRTYGFKMADSVSVNAPVTPVALGLGSITKVRFMFIRVIGGPITLQLTSAAGTDQAIKLSDEILWHAPSEGDQLTVIKVLGTADLEFILAGD